MTGKQNNLGGEKELQTAKIEKNLDKLLKFHILILHVHLCAHDGQSHDDRGR